MNIIVADTYRLGNNLIVVLPCTTATTPIFASGNHQNITECLPDVSMGTNLQVEPMTLAVSNVAGTACNQLQSFHQPVSTQPVVDLSQLLSNSLNSTSLISSNQSGNVLPEISNIPLSVNVDHIGVIPQVNQCQNQYLMTLDTNQNAMAALHRYHVPDEGNIADVAALNGVVSSTDSAQRFFMQSAHSAVDSGTLGRPLSDPPNSSSCNPLGVGINDVRTVTHRVRSEGSDVNQVVNSDPNPSPLNVRSDATTATTANTESTTSSADMASSSTMINDFGCPHCNKRFDRQSELRKHFKEHSKEEKRYHCPYTEICSKSFRQKHTLNDHIRVHTGERPFECDFCHKTFRIKNNMKVHRRIHTGEKPYLCSVCYKRFSSKSGLNSHMKHCHHSRDMQRRKEMMGNLKS